MCDDLITCNLKNYVDSLNTILRNTDINVIDIFEEEL